ncbi:MAG: hypothetical protein OIF58_17110 [Cohaesibacter sp.]|nr:hypothetical protein [Cohaesibacter sp.]
MMRELYLTVWFVRYWNRMNMALNNAPGREAMPNNNREPWHLDKRVPVALIVTLMIQTFGVIWWAASMSERVNFLERQMQERSDQSERLTRLEVNMKAVVSATTRIERKLDRRD